MFRVENADFIADKLASELLPNQEFREALKNSLEAVERRMRADGKKAGGRVEFDVDWSMHSASPWPWYIACSDNGDGMNRSELERYTTTLAVQGAGRNQSLRGNQGMGLKISGPTRHKKGVLIRSLKGGEPTGVQIGWDGKEYNLIPIGANDELVVPVAVSTFPEFVREQGSGTVVTFLGNKDQDNTFRPAQLPRGWLFRYLNQRFFRLSMNGTDVLVRVPSGDEEEWPNSPEEASDRMRKKGKSFNLSIVYGTGQVWDEAVDKSEAGWRGVEQVPGDATRGIPSARMHWWVLPPAGTGTDVSSRTYGGGSIAVLYDNELHDWKTSNQANTFFARLGVLFGKTRFGFVLEPEGRAVTSDFARAHVLVAGTPVFESDAWLQWAEQFRSRLPERIQQTIAEEQSRLETDDPDKAKRIRDRLRDVMLLLRPRHFRRRQTGTVRAVQPIAGTGDGQDAGQETPKERGQGRGSQPTGRGRGIGAVLSQVDDSAGENATEVIVTPFIDPKWVTEQEAEGMPIVNGNTHGLRDRAAALAGTDGRSANLLLLNRDFRGYQAILATINDWANPEGDDDKAARIKAAAEEWIEQKMIEAVQGLRQLENGSTWITQHYDDAMSPVSLTAAFMADRYHTLSEVRRAVGAIRSTRKTAEDRPR